MKPARVSTSHIQAVTGTTFVATLSSLLFGYCTAVICGVVDAINHNFIEPRGMHGMAANALLVGETVIYPAAFPRTRARLEQRGIRVKTVDVDEIAKAEGGVTCCSLVFGD